MRCQEMYAQNDGVWFDTVGVEWTWRGRRWRARTTHLASKRYYEARGGKTAQEAWAAVEPAKPALAAS